MRDGTRSNSHLKTKRGLGKHVEDAEAEKWTQPRSKNHSPFTSAYSLSGTMEGRRSRSREMDTTAKQEPQSIHKCILTERHDGGEKK